MGQYRVIVIGGGVSGLACGRELVQRGYDVLILEARARVGGRLKGEELLLDDTDGQDANKEDGGDNHYALSMKNKSESSLPSASLSSMASSSHPIDLGGALIHGIDKNPIHAITTQMGVTTHRISDYCLLMDQEGWPFDPKQDEKISALFNECLEETFRRAAQDRQSQASFGELFDKVLKERGTVGQTDHPLLKWHQANLELPSGAGFQELGYTWNEDEPYGFDGAHVAVEPSWKAVMEQLAEGLNILHQSAVTKIQIVLPDGTTPTAVPSSVEKEEEKPIPNETTSTVASSQAVETHPDQSENAASLPRFQQSDKGTEILPPTPTAARPGSKGGEGIKKATPRAKDQKLRMATRFSRRIRGDDTHVRRSTRATKGVIQMLQIGHGTSLSYDDPTLRQKRRLSKRTKRSNGDDEGDDIKKEDSLMSIPSSTVQVTLQNGNVLEADAVVCTVPLGVLKIPSNQTGHIQFLPPLSNAKQAAIDLLGCGLLNKCALSFPVVFWQDSDFLGLAGTRYSYLVLNAMNYTNKPILVFMYGGTFARDVESWTDAEIVYDCLTVLKKICGKDVPAPIDYCITRWGKEKYSKMAFTYIPPGVDGKKQLLAMSEPINDPVFETSNDPSGAHSSKPKPLIMFAGEHTTPYHPSTIHGAFLSGVREAYRLDLFLSPALNDYMEFETNENVYQYTFTVRGLPRKVGKELNGRSPTAAARTPNTASTIASPHQTQRRRRRGSGIMTLRKDPKTIFESPIPAAKTPPVPLTLDNGALLKSRRSKRSLSAKKPLDETDSIDKETENELEQKKRKMINSLEDRILMRALESFGRDVDLLRSKILPVYGSTRRRSVDKIRSRWQQLVKRKKQDSFWEPWKAEVIAAPPLSGDLANKGPKHEASMDGNGGNNDDNKIRRSGRAVKRKLPVDV